MVAEKSYHTPEVRGGGREELPHPGGQGPHPRGATPPPRCSCCAGTGGPRGATPYSRLELVFSYLSGKRKISSKQPSPATQEMSLYMDITRWSTPKSN